MKTRFILIAFILIFIYFRFLNKNEDPLLAKVRYLMKKHNDEIFYMCPGINNNKYFYNIKDFPKLKIIEKNANIIKKELLNVVNNFEKPGILFPIEDLQENWKNFWFLNGDNWNKENAKKCPKTFQLLKKIGVKREALFALLKPGSEIKPHKGTGNYVIRCQLPLLNIPNNSSSGIQCGPGPYIGEKRFHYTNKLIIFDDSNWHGAWNQSNLNRIVLIFDILHPNINEAKYNKCKDVHAKKMEEISNKLYKHLPKSIKN